MGTTRTPERPERPERDDDRFAYLDDPYALVVRRGVLHAQSV